MQSITAKELVSLLEKTPEKIDLIDVRGTGEYNESHIPEARNIPMHLIPMRLNEIDTKKKVILVCLSGGRSGHMCGFLENSNIQAINLDGGMMKFIDAFPNKVIHGEKKKLFGLF
ncbi:rhodanese-like domain-containing protein [Candidatus Gracilibacteria bacterium]|nr:rhodanese-like domain-containing protein [Candidatus Gracilibacteria bacterium]